MMPNDEMKIYAFFAKYGLRGTYQGQTEDGWKIEFKHDSSGAKVVVAVSDLTYCETPYSIVANGFAMILNRSWKAFDRGFDPSTDELYLGLNQILICLCRHDPLAYGEALELGRTITKNFRECTGDIL
jgi:hypothetical protein